MYMPQKQITVKGEKYVYAGDIGNNDGHKQEFREFEGKQGFKVHFKADPENKRNAFAYVTQKRFPTIQKKYRGY